MLYWSRLLLGAGAVCPLWMVVMLMLLFIVICLRSSLPAIVWEVWVMMLGFVAAFSGS